VYDTVEVYDIKAAGWSGGPPLHTARHGLAVVTEGNVVYALVGAGRPGHTASSPAGEALRLQ